MKLLYSESLKSFHIPKTLKKHTNEQSTDWLINLIGAYTDTVY